MPSIIDMKPGQTACVEAVTAGDDIRRRLVEMGILPGKTLRYVRTAPLGDPIEIDLDGCHIALRKREARTVLVSMEGVRT